MSKIVETKELGVNTHDAFNALISCYAMGYQNDVENGFLKKTEFEGLEIQLKYLTRWFKEKTTNITSTIESDLISQAIPQSDSYFQISAPDYHNLLFMGMRGFDLTLNKHEAGSEEFTVYQNYLSEFKKIMTSLEQQKSKSEDFFAKLFVKITYKTQ
jgi:hypothetical protein